MARSVCYQSGAEVVKYFIVEPVYGTYNPETDQYEGEDYNWEESQWNAEDDAENLTFALQEAFPSFTRVPQRHQCSGLERSLWNNADRECWPVLYNGSAVVYLAEYCGLYSVSFVPLEEVEADYYGPSRINVQLTWIRRIEGTINRVMDGIVDRVVCCGRFSNGEAVYSRPTKRAVLSAAVNGEYK